MLDYFKCPLTVGHNINQNMCQIVSHSFYQYVSIPEQTNQYYTTIMWIIKGTESSFRFAKVKLQSLTISYYSMKTLI